MEDRRKKPERRDGPRPANRRATDRSAVPTSVLNEVPWQAVVPMVVLVLVSLGAWRYSQEASIDEPVLEPIAYRSELRTPLLSARRIPETLQRPIADAALAPEVAALLTGSGESSCLIVQEDGRTLSSSNATTPLIPASNEKILTTAAALSLFGPDHVFTTRVTASAPVQNGVLAGDLYLIGGGDPFVSTEDWRAQYGDDQDGRTFTSLETLADRVAATGVRTITGAVQGDESYFDSQRTGPWADRLIDSNQSGPLSALAVNEGFTDWPSLFSGSFRARTPAPDPALNAAEVFAGLLASRGVIIEGGVRSGPAPAGQVEVAAVASPPLLDIIIHINSYSNNYGAEILVKHLGVLERGSGSLEAGMAVIVEVLQSEGYNLAGVQLDDGSGLAESDRVTCGLLAEVLNRSGPDGILTATLSIGGERGSLAPRHEGTEADGRVFAKTGTLNSALSLSGFAESFRDPDTDIVFTYIVNGQGVALNEPLRQLQEPFIEALVAYPDAPSLSSLGPLQP